MDLFARSLTALHSAVDELSDADFARPSGCSGWVVRDLVCHLIVDAQDVLITLVTPDDGDPTRDATSYWDVLTTAPSGDDPLDALIPRLAAAYQEPWLLRYHFDDLAAAAARAADLVDATRHVRTKGEVLTAEDYLGAYVLEWTLHHLDLTSHLHPARALPPPESLARSREMLQTIAGVTFPAAISDADALLIGTGRRGPSTAEVAELGAVTGLIPVVLG